MLKHKDLRDQFIDARLAADKTQIEASIEIGCGLTTLSRFENNNQIPKTVAVLRNIKEFIQKYHPKK
jgi:hypothetical protein